jgi:hypothetical protein
MTKLSEQLRCDGLLIRVEPVHCFGNHRRVIWKHSADERVAGWREHRVARPPVARTLLALDEPLFGQTVDEVCDAAARD